MRIARPLAAAVAALLVASTTLMAAQRYLADVTGKWNVGVNMGDRTSESVITFKQTGDSLSGTIESEQIGSSQITGVVKGDTVRFDFSIDMQGNKLAIQGDGILQGKDAMAGQLSLAGMGTFPFNAKRQP